VLHKLRDEGNTVVVIEHNLDVIKTADWIVDLGPEGGHRGGTILVTGTPEDVAAHPASYTGQFLAKMLPSVSARPERPAAVANKPDARPPRKAKPEKPAKVAKKAVAATRATTPSKTSPAKTTKAKKK
jgi:excinuclease ABC subunit A